MSQTFLRLVGLVLSFCACSGPAKATHRDQNSLPRRACIVRRISDGDSLYCADGERVRLLLIDAPEMAQRPFGQQAKAALERLAPEGARLELELDVRTRDQHGRLLAYAYASDGRMINEEMARAGQVVALVYPPDVRYVDRIRAAVFNAREQRVGLWATEAFRCEPRRFRARRCGAALRPGGG